MNCEQGVAVNQSNQKKQEAAGAGQARGRRGGGRGLDLCSCRPRRGAGDVDQLCSVGVVWYVVLLHVRCVELVGSRLASQLHSGDMLLTSMLRMSCVTS